MSEPSYALVVDDEPVIARTVSLVLKGDGWGVDVAESGEQALEMIAAKDYDVMLLDLRLPGIQGVDVLRRVAEDGARVRVVVMTAYGSAESAIETMSLGAADILRKPFTPAELRETVSSVLERETDPDVIGRQFLDTLASAKELLGAQRVPAANVLASRAVALRPDRPEGYHLLGVCHELIGELVEAKKMYRLALEVDPEYASSKRNLDRLVFYHGTRGSVEFG